MLDECTCLTRNIIVGTIEMDEGFSYSAEQKIQLVIRDSGQGFNLEEAYSRRGTTKGLGLDSMKERIELSGGSLDIESVEGKGTNIYASWPLGQNG